VISSSTVLLRSEILSEVCRPTLSGAGVAYTSEVRKVAILILLKLGNQSARTRGKLLRHFHTKFRENSSVHNVLRKHVD